MNDLVGRHFEELTEQSDRPAHPSPMQELAKFGSVVTMHRVRGSNGEPIDVEISSTLLARRRHVLGGARHAAAARRDARAAYVRRSRAARLGCDASASRARVARRPAAVRRDADAGLGLRRRDAALRRRERAPRWRTTATRKRSSSPTRSCSSARARTWSVCSNYSHDEPGLRPGRLVPPPAEGRSLIDVETISYGFELDGRKRAHRRDQRRHRSAARAAAAGAGAGAGASRAEDGCGRPARRRRGARLQQPAQRHPGRGRDAGQGARVRTIRCRRR